ncbi:MAG: hypothetical protein ABG776_17535 [Cyanobacteria bacterium J06555_13]
MGSSIGSVAWAEVEMPTVDHGAEVAQFHTRLLRVSLALDESRTYWEHAMPELPKTQRALLAFEGRWFGSKSMERVKRLLAEFSHRYEMYPDVLAVLRQWKPKDPVTRQNICHWHLQLTDPMYRAFTGDFLEQRRFQSAATINRDIAARWVSQNLSTQWASATVLRMATALITCATAAGLCESTPGSRSLGYPKVTDEALGYWLYTLRGLQFEGTLLANPYLASVGLSEGFLEDRLRQLSGLRFSRMGELHEFQWQYPDVSHWAKGELALTDQLHDREVMP